MKSIPINICLFTTTKGHFGRKDIYQKTIEDLDKQSGGLSQFTGLFAHIKQSPRDDAAPMKTWLEQRGFSVLVTEGQWSHGDLSHQAAYLSDIRNLFNRPELHQNMYSLWLEDDWIFEPNKIGFLEALALAGGVLGSDPDVNGVRFLRKEDDIASRIETKPYGDRAVGNRVEFSFNPTLVRTRDVYLTMALVFRNIRQLSTHCELAYTQIASMLTEGETPFVSLNRDEITVRHIGTPESA